MKVDKQLCSSPGVRYAEPELSRTDSCRLSPVPGTSLQLQEPRYVPEQGGENHRDDVDSTGECGENISETLPGITRQST